MIAKQTGAPPATTPVGRLQENPQNTEHQHSKYTPKLLETQAYGRIEPWQRFKRGQACPICGGGDQDKRGRGERCTGYLSKDEHYAHCSREEYAGDLRPSNATPPTYAHRLDGPCKCGQEHGAISDSPRLYAAPASTPTRAHLRATPTAIYAYGDGLRKLRYGTGKGKYFVWQHADGAGDWLDGREDLRPGLYRVESVAAASPLVPVFFPEGEGKADALAALGAVAVSPPDGAGSWRQDYTEAFTGRHVVILADADDPGRQHAATVASDLSGIAASVRVLELDGVHDVGDWLADGHTLIELLNITACMLPIQQSTPALQEAQPQQTQKTCSRCTALETQLQIAETSLRNLRRERAIETRYLRMPSTTLSAPVKLAAIVVRRELTAPTQSRPHDEQGLEQVYRAAIATQLGVQEQAASTYLRKLGDAGLIKRRVVKSFDTSAIYIGVGPLADDPEQVQEPERPHSWGGKREKHCPECGGHNLEIRTFCRDCGTILEQRDVNEPPEVVDADPDTQDHPRPVNTILDALAPDAQDICYACGGELQDYGPKYGTRCLVCDREQPREEAS